MPTTFTLDGKSHAVSDGDVLHFIVAGAARWQSRGGVVIELDDGDTVTMHLDTLEPGEAVTIECDILSPTTFFRPLKNTTRRSKPALVNLQHGQH